MRVIAGELRGRRLLAPEGLETRPTSDKVKEALFSIIQFDVPESRFLDLFAGSGQMGIEAISRGAKRAVFVDADRTPFECIKYNIKTVSVSEKTSVYQKNVADYLYDCNEKFDIVFMDPPYKTEEINSLLDLAANVCSEDGIIICEVALNKELNEEFSGFKLKKRYRYGKTELALYRRSSVQTEIY